MKIKKKNKITIPEEFFIIFLISLVYRKFFSPISSFKKKFNPFKISLKKNFNLF